MVTTGSMELVHLSHHAGLPGAIGLAPIHSLCALPGLQHSWVGYGVGAVGHMMMWHMGLGGLRFLFILLRDRDLGNIRSSGFHMLHPHCVEGQIALCSQLCQVASRLVVEASVDF